MASWTEEVVNRFFSDNKTVSRAQCDERALSILGSGFKEIQPVDTPGSLSYTVKGTTSVIISFRKYGSKLDPDMVKLSRDIHGNLSPGACYHGTISKSDVYESSLSIYTMPLLPGVAALNVFAFSPNMDDKVKAKHLHYIKDLAQYFARCWSNPQPVDLVLLKTEEQNIRDKLNSLKKSETHAYLKSVVNEVDRNMHKLFDQDYPQVLTHGDLSLTNILLNDENLGISGIIDWSLAAILPFGLDLDTLRLTTGNMDLQGWYDYECRERLDIAFWCEFFGAIGVKDKLRQNDIKSIAEVGAKLGAILRYAFKRDERGSSSDIIASQPSAYLQAWFRKHEWSKLMHRQ
ncbi:hypothetical protein F5Y16DRAFT_405082 [Xylariaceae sp. FL0255]|nr:hypothetical protein F5Y16DRAFT_405082 [Xylariaceae sp. FL0255]